METGSTDYSAMSVEELDAELIRRCNEKDEYLASWKEEHRKVQAAHQAAVEAFYADRPAPQVIDLNEA